MTVGAPPELIEAACVQCFLAASGRSSCLEGVDSWEADVGHQVIGRRRERRDPPPAWW